MGARRREARPGLAFGLALALTSLSGAAGLAHELLWTRRLTDLLGTTGSASARVLGAFFLGLALGAAWASPRVARAARPWRAAALAELGVVALSMPILFLPDWTAWLWPRLGPENLTNGLGTVCSWALALLVVAPPAAAMGAVLPFLAAGVLNSDRPASRHGTWLYAANTLGGVLGLVAAVLVLLPRLGAMGAMAIVAGTNLMIAAVLFGMDRRDAPLRNKGPAKTMAAPTPSETSPPVTGALALAFASGMGVLAAEVLALEMVMLAAPLSYFAPAAVLAAVVLALGLAALVSPWTRRAEAPGHNFRLGRLLSLGGLGLVFAPVIFHVLAMTTGPLFGDPSVARFTLRLMGLTIGCLGPAFLVMGQVFPEAIASDAERAGRAGPEAASRLGVLLAWNGLGGLVGCELVYQVIMPTCGSQRGLLLVGLAYAGAGLVLSWRPGRVAQRQPYLAATALVIVVAVGAGVVAGLPEVQPRPDQRVLDLAFGREGTVAVIEKAGGARAILLANQYTLGGTDARWDQERQAHLPLLLHKEPRDVGFIGLATGITPGAALVHRDVRSLTVVEVSPLVVRAADRWFLSENHGVTRDPRARVVVEDGRVFVAACEERFDVLVGDLYLPWGPGEGRLFSLEHYQAARRALRSGGLFCQWLPLFQLTPEQFRWVVATFQRAFPRAHLIRGELSATRPVCGLVGFADADGDWDWEVVAARAGEGRAAGWLSDPMLRHVEAIEMLYMGPCAPADPATPINTLGNLRLEIDASRERVTGNPAAKYLHGTRFVWSLLVPLEATAANATPRSADPADMERRARMRLGMRLSAWDNTARDLERRSRATKRTPLPSELVEALPPNLREDSAADWSRWSGPKLAPSEAGGGH